MVSCYDGHNGSSSSDADGEPEEEGDVDWGAALDEQGGGDSDAGSSEEEKKYHRDGAKYYV